MNVRFACRLFLSRRTSTTAADIPQYAWHRRRLSEHRCIAEKIRARQGSGAEQAGANVSSVCPRKPASVQKNRRPALCAKPSADMLRPQVAVSLENETATDSLRETELPQRAVLNVKNPLNDTSIEVEDRIEKNIEIGSPPHR